MIRRLLERLRRKPKPEPLQPWQQRWVDSVIERETARRKTEAERAAKGWPSSVVDGWDCGRDGHVFGAREYVNAVTSVKCELCGHPLRVDQPTV